MTGIEAAAQKRPFKFKLAKLAMVLAVFGVGMIAQDLIEASRAAVWQWSKTSASNSIADPTINWAEGMPPGSVNDSARAMMARLSEFRDDTSGLLVTSGSSTAYTLTTNQGLQTPTPVDGQLIVFSPHTSNGTAATLAADGGTAFPLQSAPGAALGSGVLTANIPYQFKFSNASSAWILFGSAPSPNAAAFTLQGNPTNSSASPSAFTIDSLIAKSPPAAADEFLIWDVAGAAMKKSVLTLSAGTLANSAIGYSTGMLNGTLSATVGSSALTITLQTLAGATPSASDPVFFLITNGAGSWTVIKQTSALSITVPSAATVGTVSAQANRLWVGVFNNSGTAALGVYNSLNASTSSILPWDETSSTTGTAITGTSNNSQQWYTASGVTGNFRVIGYVESTQATAGTWATSPSKTQLFGPGVKKPGDTVQELSTFNTSSPNTASTSYVALSGANLSITPTSAANVIHARSAGGIGLSSNGIAFATLSRGTTNNTNLLGVPEGMDVQAQAVTPGFVEAYDTPNTTSAQAYSVQGKSNNGAVTMFYGGGTLGITAGFSIVLRELQI